METINKVIFKLGYTNLLIGLSLLSIAISIFRAVYVEFNYLEILTSIFFALALFLIAYADIRAYFLFFIFFLIKTFSIFQTLYVKDSFSIFILVIITMAFLVFFVHGYLRWSARVTENKTIVPKVKSVHMPYYFLMLIIFSIGAFFIFTPDYSFNKDSIIFFFDIFAITSLVIAIFLINERFILGWLFVLIYFVCSLDNYSTVFDALQTICYILFTLVAYKNWDFINYLAKKNNKRSRY